MKNSLKKISAAVLSLAMMIGTFGGASATSIGLETTDFTDQELQEIAQTNQTISDSVNSAPQTRAGDSKVLPMTVVRQQNNYYCGPATACMVAKTLGLGTYSQSNMAGILGTTTSGTSSDQIVSGLNSLLRSSSLSGRYQRANTSNSNLPSSIIYSLQNNFPVVVNVKVMPNYSVGVGHFVAVNGYYAAFAGSSYVNDVKICDPHPTYYGSYTYSMDTIVNACNSAVGNFCRLA